MIPNPEPKTLSELLDLLERGKVGYAYAMDFLGVDDLGDLFEIVRFNCRRLPGICAGGRSLSTPLYRGLGSRPRRYIGAWNP
jgi:hypothetical protein